MAFEIIHFLSSGNFRFNVKDLPQIPLETDKVFWVRVSYIADPELIYVQPLDVVGYEGKLIFLDYISKIIRITIFLYM